MNYIPTIFPTFGTMLPSFKLLIKLFSSSHLIKLLEDVSRIASQFSLSLNQGLLLCYVIDFELMSIQEGLPSLDACTVLTVLSLLFAFTRRLAFIEYFQRASTNVPKCLALIWRIPRAHDTPKSSCQTLPVSKYFSCHAEM